MMYIIFSFANFFVFCCYYYSAFSALVGDSTTSYSTLGDVACFYSYSLVWSLDYIYHPFLTFCYVNKKNSLRAVLLFMY